MSADADRIAMCRHDNLPHLCRVCLNDRIAQLTAELAEARENERRINREREALCTSLDQGRAAHERTKTERDVAREQIASEACRVGEALASRRRELTLASEHGRGHVRQLIDVLHFIAAERDAAQADAAAMRSVIVVQMREGHFECMSCNRTAAYNAEDDLEHTDDCPLAGNAGRDLAARVPLWRALERLVRGGCTPLNERVGKLLFDLAALDAQETK